MLLLQILNGKKAGAEFSARRFPVNIGRSASNHLVLEEPGVWADHFQILFSCDGLILKTSPQAPILVNDQPLTETVLRNGDLITLGLLKIRFGFTPVRQRNQKLVEWLTWLGLASLYCGQISLIYWLLLNR